MKPEELQDLEIGRSFVRISATSIIGVVTAIDGDKITVTWGPNKDTRVFHPVELVYHGTPGTDAPYLSDYY